MTVKQGEQVTLVGRTGAGKSTVFVAARALSAESGSITIGGVDVSDIADSERRACIGCVEQHFSRVPGTVLDQITLGDARITEKMAKSAARLAGIDAAITSLPEGYDTVCTDGMFSQGEWRLSPSPAPRRQTPPCCCSTRSPQILTPRPRRACSRHCAPRLRGAHRSLRFAPRLRKPRRTDDRDPAAAGVTGKKSLPFLLRAARKNGKINPYGYLSGR